MGLNENAMATLRAKQLAEQQKELRRQEAVSQEWTQHETRVAEHARTALSAWFREMKLSLNRVDSSIVETRYIHGRPGGDKDTPPTFDGAITTAAWSEDGHQFKATYRESRSLSGYELDLHRIRLNLSVSIQIAATTPRACWRPANAMAEIGQALVEERRILGRQAEPISPKLPSPPPPPRSDPAQEAALAAVTSWLFSAELTLDDTPTVDGPHAGAHYLAWKAGGRQFFAIFTGEDQRLRIEAEINPDPGDPLALTRFAFTTREQIDRALAEERHRLSQQ